MSDSRFSIPIMYLVLCLGAFTVALLNCPTATAATHHQRASSQQASVNNVRLWRDKEYTRIVLDLNAAVKYSLSQASAPDRIYIDINNTALKVSLDRLALQRTPVDIVRSSIINGKDLRLTLELKQKVQPKTFFLKKEGKNGDRLVIDLYDLKTDSANAAPLQSPPSAAPEKVSQPAAVGRAGAAAMDEPAGIEALVGETSVENKKAVANLSGKRDILITVDAGHGGQDTGALGPNGLREKDITLAIAKELVAALNAEPGFSAHLTRREDIFIPLKVRRNIARDKKADLFVSIHADAFTNPLARGASVFALSRKGATSETARFLAQHENESDAIGGVAGISLDDKDAVLAGVLVDLSMTATVNTSLLIGNQVLKSIGNIATLHGRHVEQAGFMVLKSPDVPSLLIETGFISNREESRKLATAAYRTQMALAIVKGLRQYYVQHPPVGTYLAELKGGKANIAMEREHLVVRGDSLSNIAARYNVKQSHLARHNGLPINASVKLGQTLKIPAQ